ncbi:MBL fold metallo-hydrolase [Burkholderia sp. MR1-5-21]
MFRQPIRLVMALTLAPSLGLAPLAQAAPAHEAPATAHSAPASGAVTGLLGVTRIRPDVVVLSGAGANIVVQIGPQGALVVDSGTASSADQVLAAIRSLTDAPIRFLFNTGADAAHVGGNLTLSTAGKAFGQSSGPFTLPGRATVVATVPVLQRMTEENYESEGLPTQTVRDRKALYLNGQGIEVYARAGAHSDADAVVLFRGSDVLVTGEIFDITHFPAIDVEHGGTIQGEIDALNALIDLAIPNVPLTWLEGGTMVVPARGRPCQQAELVEYRDMVTIIRDRVRALKTEGRTLAQVIEAKPAAGYAPRYGASSGPGSTAGFLEAIYRSLGDEKHESGSPKTP